MLAVVAALANQPWRLTAQIPLVCSTRKIYVDENRPGRSICGPRIDLDLRGRLILGASSLFQTLNPRGQTTR